MRQKEDNNKDDYIELRSDNTRRFIDEEPPFLIRNGTVLISTAIILIGIIVFLYYFNDKI